MKAFSLSSRFLSLRVVVAVVALAWPRAVTANGGVFRPLVPHDLGLNIFAFENLNNWTGETIGSLFNHALEAAQEIVFIHNETTSAAGLTFSLEGSHPFTLRGIGNRTLTLEGDIEVTSSNAAIVTIGATQNLQHLELKLSGNRTFAVAADKLLTIVNSISDLEGSYTLTKSGDGTLVLSGTSTYGGGTTITAGTIRTTVANALPTFRDIEVELHATLTLGENQTLAGLIGHGNVEIGAGKTLTLHFDYNTLNFSGVISGATGRLVKSGSGTQKLSGNNTYGGGTEITGGQLRVYVKDALPTAGAVTIGDAVLALDYDQTIGSLAGSSDASVTLADDRALTVNGSASTTFAGTISGDGSLVKDGSGTLTLTGANTFTVATTVSGGTLQLGNGGSNGSIATDVSVASGATLAFHPNTNTRFDKVISGEGAVTTTGAVTLTLGADNSYSGGTTINGGTLTVVNTSGSGTGTGSVTINGGTVLQIGDATTPNAGSVAGAITNNGTLYFNRPGTLTHASVISGGGTMSVEKGTVTLTGANTYNGGTTIKDGAVLALGNTSGATLATGADIMLEGAGELQVNQNQTIRGLKSSSTDSRAVIASEKALTINLPDATDTNHTAATFAGVISGDGALVMGGPGTFTVTGANTYLGGTTINQGTLVISQDGNLGAVPANATPGSLAFNGGILKTTESFTLAAHRGISFGANGGEIRTESGTTLTYGGVVTGQALKKSGVGTLTLSGANAYTGATRIDAGTLKVTGQTNVLPTGTGLEMAAGAAFKVDASQTIQRFVNSGAGASIEIASGKVLNVTLGANPGAGTQFAGTISGDGGFRVGNAGNFGVTLTGNNTYGGGTTIDANAFLQLGSGGTTGMIAGNVTNNGRLSFSRSDAVTFGGTISGTGAVTQMAGSGALTFSGPNTYQGGTLLYSKLIVTNSSGSATGSGGVDVFSGAVLAGTGSIAGALNVKSGGTVAPGLASGAPGKLKAGPTTFVSGGNFDFQITDASEGAGTHYSLLEISGALTIDASSESPFIVNLLSFNGSIAGTIANFDATQTYTWKFASATSLAGTLDGNAFHVNTANFSNSLAGGSFAVGFVGNDLFVNFTPVPEPSTWALLALGLGAVWVSLRRGRRIAGGK